MADVDKDETVPIEPDPRVAMGPGHIPPTSFDPSRLDFGHHIGRSIEELAELDPDYLAWLERHPAGARYRGEIRRVRNGSGVRRY